MWGGVSFGGLLNKKTIYTIDLDNRTVTLTNHNLLELIRKDNTIRDIDIILFCDDSKKLLAFKKFLIDLEQAAQKKKQLFPVISAENAIYETLGIRNPINQFVTALEVDKKGKLYLAFDEIQQEINWQSVEPWHVILANNTSYTVRNPIADYYAYFFRSPGGLKPKDEKKVRVLQKLKDSVVGMGLEHQPNIIEYISDTYYKTWEKYIDRMNKSKSLRVRLKIGFLWIYWRTIGTALSHGKTVIFANRFTGIKQ